MQLTKFARIIALLALCACLATGGRAQVVPANEVGDITGMVKDASTGRPLYPANILILGENWGTISLEDGTFTIKNVPVGTYRLLVQMMGYADKTVSDVTVTAGGSVRVTFELESQIALELNVIEITGQKQKIDKTETGTSHAMTSQELSDLPVDDIAEAISLQAGVIAQGGELHFRGGRASEVQYQVDGVPVRDPLVGGDVALATLALDNQETILGGMTAKYGNAQSGVVLFKTKEGSDHFSGELRYQTDDYGQPDNTYDNYDRIFFGLGGPMPVDDMTFYGSVQATYQDDYPPTPEKRSREKILNFISVGDRKDNDLKFQGKLAYKPSPNHKLTFELIDQETRSDTYYHIWSRSGFVQEFLDTTRTEEVVLRHGRWSPTQIDSTYKYYNAAEHTPDRLNQFEQQKVVFYHSLNKNAQYTLKLSRQHFFQDFRVGDKKEWEYDGERNRDFWFNYWDGESYDFFVTAGDYPVLSTRETSVLLGIFDLTIQKGRHTLETGGSIAYNDMRYFQVVTPYLTNARGEIGGTRTRYHYYNPEAGAYITDRWEHEGMVINVGMRWDLFSVGDQVPLSEVQEKVKQQLSPRIGIAYPISDRDVFSFNYGRYYQIPDRQYLFDDLETFDGTRGNPNLTNETTVAYQAAIQHLFTELLVGQFSVYYKDIFGQLTAEETPNWATTGNVAQWVNKDYASSKGFDVSLNRGFQNYMNWGLNYSYGVANGVASDPNAAVARNFVYLPTGEQPLNWDARHSIGANLYLGDRRNWGVSLSWSYTTGVPYTPYQRDTRELEPEMVNSRRLPSTSSMDVRADKYYQLWGKNLSIFLQARNILDAKNIRNLNPNNYPNPPVNDVYVEYYTETGRAGGAFLEDRDGDGVDEFIPLNDPRVYGTPRTIRVGVGFTF